MRVTATELFLVAMMIILTGPFLIWRLFRTDHYAPLVVVQIIAGILLGPGVLGVAAPELHGAIFTADVIAALNGVAWWAVMLFVFVAGLELDLREAWRRKVDTGVTAGLALLTPLALGSLAAFALIGSGNQWIGASASHWQAVLGIGMACAVTALPILVLLMDRLEILRLPLGQRILRYASLDDLAIWGVLALVLVDWDRAGRQLAFLVVFAIAAALARMLMRRLSLADRWPVGLIWLTGVALGADWAGLHFMVGAFLAGTVLESEWFGTAAVDRFRDSILLAFMPVFFLSTGLRTEWQAGGLAVIAAAALLLLAAVAGKLIGIFAASRILRWQPGEAWIIGWLLQTKALIMIIFANVLLDRAIISSDAFTALLLMAVASTMLTIPMVRDRLKGRLADLGEMPRSGPPAAS